MHLDPAGRFVVEADMAPLPDVEVAPQQAVCMAQHVQVEGGRDAERVVVGGIEDGLVLGQVDTDEQGAILAAAFAQAGEEGARFGRREITQG
jgi:hypothetical protein